MARFYVTTSIPYVNGDPHLGHALEFVQGDVLARHRRLRGDEVRYQSGTDDNSLKNVRAAERAGRPVQEFVDAHAEGFVELADGLGISFDDLIRTSRDPRHQPGVHKLWQAAAERGDLYRKHYEGLYCVGCETFYTPEELVDGTCPEHETEPELVAEENWFFRLSSYQEQLRAIYESGQIRIEPQQKANEVKAFIDGGLRDFSISRSVRRAHGWGVPVPGDPGQVMYVWWDALGNYVTALGFGGDDETEYDKWWAGESRRVHVIGKDIVRFHAIYWPAMLLSAGLPLPTDIYVHDFITTGNRRIGKSLGNAVNPSSFFLPYGKNGESHAEVLRWWLVSQVPKVGDTEFSIDRTIEVANRELAGGIGNLVQRVTTMVHRYRDGVVPEVDEETVDLLTEDLAAKVGRALEAFDLRAGAAAIVQAVTDANRYIENVRPWELAKAEQEGASRQKLDIALCSLVCACREIVPELSVFLPSLAAKVATQVGGNPLPAVDPVFPRLEPRENLR